ncbi:MAG TPA: hypothetical protein VN026_18840 [Bacteroidia bacterium]|jgi:hypothetical protein|nr:hypothetical protein [Bacteroidia bacterium]
MKSNKLIYTLALIVLSGTLAFTGCKKLKEFKNETGQDSADNRTAVGESDNAIADANNVASNNSSIHGRVGQIDGVLSVCTDYTVDVTKQAQGILTVNYNGTSCLNRTRSGSIRLTLQNYPAYKWKDVNAVLQVDYINYKVTRTSDGKSVELNGTELVTNVSGNTWFELIFQGQPNLVHTVTGSNLNVTFDGDKTAVYNINRKFTYTWSSPYLSCYGEGTGISNNRTNLENYGTTRNGDNFTSQVTTPFIWTTACGAHAPTQGAVDIKVDSKAFDLKCTFGVDANGNGMSVPLGSCAYGMKAEWTYKKKTNHKVFSYY